MTSCVNKWLHTKHLGSIFDSVTKRLDDDTLTVVYHASVLVGQADVGLLLAHYCHVLLPQASVMAGEDEGVAVSARAVLCQQPARVVHGVIVVVSVDDPVDVVCRGKSFNWFYCFFMQAFVQYFRSFLSVTVRN